MTEIILGLVIFALLGGLFFERREHVRQVKDLILKQTEQVKDLTSKIMAKNLNEYVLTEAKKPLSFEQLSEKNAAKESDLIEIDQMEEEEILEAASKTAEKLRKDNVTNA